MFWMFVDDYFVFFLTVLIDIKRLVSHKLKARWKRKMKKKHEWNANRRKIIICQIAEEKILWGK